MPTLSIHARSDYTLAVNCAIPVEYITSGTYIVRRKQKLIMKRIINETCIVYLPG